MLKVAVTGNMGSGKTTVCRIFESLSIPVFYADAEAKKLYHDLDVLNILVDRFGKRILNENKQLDFKAFGGIIFKDNNSLEFVNQLIHPLVFKKFGQWMQQQIHKPYCIQESALTFETGNYKKMDKTILVTAPDELLISRVMQRDGSTAEQVTERLNRQLPQNEKKKLADYCIVNDNKTLVIPQVLEINNILLGGIVKPKFVFSRFF